MNSAGQAPQDMRKGQRQRLAAAVLVSAAWFVVFELLLSPLLSLPLRLLSTELAATGLRMVGIPAQMQGSAISANAFLFEVIEDCSGSTTIQMMIATAILLLGFCPHVRLLHRLTLLIAAIPFALLANSLRIAAIVASSFVLEQPLRTNDPGHTAVGVGCYLLGTFLFYRICRTFDSAGNTGAHQWLTWGLIGGCSLLIFAPLLVSTLFSLYAAQWNPGILWNPLFFLIAAISAYYRLSFRVATTRGERGTGTALLIVGLLFALAGKTSQMPAVQGGSLLLVVIGLILLKGGARTLLRSVPVLTILICGLPRTGRLAADLLSGLTHGELLIRNEALLLRVLVVLVMVVWCIAQRKRILRPEKNVADASAASNETALWLFLVAALIALGISFCKPGSASAGRATDRLLIPYRLPGWTGIDAGTAGGEAASLFAGESGAARRYRGPGDYSVDVLVTFAGDKRENLHLPEYCFTAAGWTAWSWKMPDFVRRKGLPEIVCMQKGDDRLYLGSWYWSGGRIYRFYSMLIADDLYNRMVGRTSEIYIFRVASKSEASLLCFYDSLDQAGIFHLPEQAP